MAQCVDRCCRIVDARREGLDGHVSQLPEAESDVLGGGPLVAGVDGPPGPFSQPGQGIGVESPCR